MIAAYRDFFNKAYNDLRKYIAVLRVQITTVLDEREASKIDRAMDQNIRRKLHSGPGFAKSSHLRGMELQQVRSCTHCGAPRLSANNQSLAGRLSDWLRHHRDQPRFPRGGVPSSNYQILINNTPVDLGDSETPLDKPSFRNTLSAGDKSTLALAFFLAQLANDPGKANKIVIFDDPFNSQEWLPQRTYDSPNQEVRGGADRNALKNYYINHDGQARDVVQKIRPVLETYCKNLVAACSLKATPSAPSSRRFALQDQGTSLSRFART